MNIIKMANGIEHIHNIISISKVMSIIKDNKYVIIDLHIIAKVKIIK